MNSVCKSKVYIKGVYYQKEFRAMSKENETSTDNIVETVKSRMPEDEYLYDLSELFRIFGDSTRIKILYSLFDNELCVGDISSVLGLSQSSVSHQLRILKYRPTHSI